MKTELSDTFKVFFVVFVCLSVYYPTIFGEVNTVDDQRLITTLINVHEIDVKDAFLPGRSLYYYRPMLWLTFVLDRFLFGCSAAFMHLFNVLLHTMNAVLVFLIIRELQARRLMVGTGYAPLLVALLFALHPLNTEPVNWISGRTDLLAALFVFVSFLVLLNKGLQSLPWCFAAALLYLMGLLSKEVALGLLPAVALLLLTRCDYVTSLTARKRWTVLSIFALTTVSYLFLRNIASGFSDSGMATATAVTPDGDPLGALSSALKAFGFYVKKLFLPLPLNFGIIEINRELYLAVGIVSLLLAVVWFSVTRGFASYLFVFAIVFFLPAIPVALSKMAWTPLAERYLYLSTLGITACVVEIAARLPLPKSAVWGCLIAVLLAATCVTTERNIVWQQNLTLFEDTVRKSPNFAAGRNEYAIALLSQGKKEEALKQFSTARQLSGDTAYKAIPALNQALLSEPTMPMKASAMQERLGNVTSSPQLEATALSRILKAVIASANEEQDPVEKREHFRQAIAVLERLYQIEPRGFYQYRAGQMYLILGEKDKALGYFRRAAVLSPNEYFAGPARKLVADLEHELAN